MKRLLMLVAAAFFASLPVWAEEETIGDYTWTYYISNSAVGIYNSGSAAISPSPTGYVTIPSTLGGKTLTGIWEFAFYECTGMTGVTIPNSITAIESYAFGACDGLIDLTIPDSVASIGDWAFGYCGGLESVTIGNGVTNIGNTAFHDCTSLTNIIFRGNAPTIGKQCFGFNGGNSGCTVYVGRDSTGWGVDIPGTWQGMRIEYLVEGLQPVFKIENGVLTEVELNGATNVVIPSSVTSIGDNAFYYCSGLTSVTIPDSVTSIEQAAFSGCSGLTSVTFPDSVTSIGRFAFSGCSGLTSVTIPDSVTSIRSQAFMDCSGLLSITVGSGNAHYTSANGLLLSKDGTTLIEGVNGDVTIPGSVTSIGSCAFMGRSGLTGVTIPNSVTSIGSSAFWYCSGLTNVTIPDSVTSIWGYAFYGCSGLTSVTIPDSVTNIGESAFSGCSGLADEDGFVIIRSVLYGYFGNATQVTIPGSVTSIERDAFARCSGLTSVTIPDSVTSIGGGAFYNCSGLTSVTISDSVASVGSEVFSGCSPELYDTTTIPGVELVDGWVVGYTSSLSDSLNLTGVRGITCEAFRGCDYFTNVTIPDSVTSIGDYAFESCSGLTSVTLPDSVTSIGEGAFIYCGLTSVAIPDSVTSIGDYAFEGCRELTSVAIPDSVTSIGDGAFTYCGLTSVAIPDSVTSIGDNAFGGCENLTSASIPQVLCQGPDSGMIFIWAGFEYVTNLVVNGGVTNIGDYAFESCSGLTSVTIPNSVTNIGEGAFADCDCLATVKMPDGVTSISDGLFIGCYSLSSVTIPDGVTRIGHSAFQGCSITSVIIPDGVEDIGEGAFWCCALTSVTIPDSVTSIGGYAFYGVGLTSVIFNGNAPDIGEYAFDGVDPGCAVFVRRDSTGWGVDIPGTWQGMRIEYLVEGLQPVFKIENGVLTEVELNGATDVVIPDSVTSIGSSAFYGCSGLTRVTIPDSVTNIVDAFYGCSGLMSFVVDNGNTNYASVNGLLLSRDGKTLVAGVNGNVTIPDGVTSIGFGAFFIYSGLTSVTIPDSVTNIDPYAFFGCDGLTGVTIGAGVVNIGGFAFYDCSGLTNVVFAGNAPVIGGNAFDGVDPDCTVFVRRDSTGWGVDIPGTWHGVRIEYLEVEFDFSGDAEWTLEDDGSWKSGAITHGQQTSIIKTVVGAGTVAFDWKVSSESNYDWLTFYIDGIQKDRISGTAGDWTSMTYEISGGGTHTLTWTYSKDSSESRGSDCGWISFGSTSSSDVADEYYDAVLLPGRSGERSFSNEGATIDEGEPLYDWFGPDVMGSVWFRWTAPCNGMATFSTSGSDIYAMLGIYRYVAKYEGYYSYDEVVTADVYIGRCSFVAREGETYYVCVAGFYDSGNIVLTWDCEETPYGTPVLVIENGVLTEVGLNGATNVVIPTSVTSIGTSAFSYCSGLTSVTIPDSVTSIGSSAFYGCSGLTSVTIPDSVTSIGYGAFRSCIELKLALVPSRLRDGISRDNQFADCASNLRVVFYEGTVADIEWTSVSLDANGGEITEPFFEFPKGQSIGELPRPTRADHRFVGWFTAADGGELVTEERIVNGGAILYAHWEKTECFYVDVKYGNDANDGLSWDRAIRNLQTAIDITHSGDRIVVADGIYSSIDTKDKMIYVCSVNGALNTFIDGGHTNRCATLTSTKSFSSHANAKLLAETNTVLVGFTLCNGYVSGTTSAYAGGVCGGTLRSCIVSNCTVEATMPQGTYSEANGGGAYCGALENCLVVGNHAISTYYAHGGGVFYSTLYNCTVVGNSAFGDSTKDGGSGWGGGANTMSAYNSIIWGNFSDNSSSNIQNVAMHNSWTDWSGLPRFVDAEHGDYRLRADSPCVDAGNNSYSMTGTDLAGLARIVNGTVDIGAYEFHGADLPDIVVSSMFASSTSFMPDDTVTVQYVEMNIGTTNAVAPWYDRVMLEGEDGTRVNLKTLDSADWGQAGLPIGAVVTNVVECLIPDLVPLAGNVRFVVAADVNGDVEEINETNNEGKSGVVSLGKKLYLTAASESVKENVSSGVRFTVRRSGPVSAALTVTVDNTDTASATAPATVTIPAGSVSTIFTVAPIDNAIVDGTRVVNVSVSAAGFASTFVPLTILDDEVPRLTVTLDKTSVREGDGVIAATVTREGATDGDLTVYLAGSSERRASYPSSVVIPSGAASVTFEISVPNNDTAQVASELTLRASSSGYQSAAVTYTVEDDDVPGVVLTIAPEEVQEGGVVHATLERVDLENRAKAITVRLTASNPDDIASMPSSITIPAGKTTVGFYIYISDDGLDNVNHKIRYITIDGAVLIESCGCNGQPSSGDAISATLGIIDNDGPALSLRAEPATMREGRDPAGYLILSHNSMLAEDLQVDIWADAAGADEVELPEYVIIPAGTTSVRIPVKTLDDGVEDGSQLISVYAKVDGNAFAPASTWVQVSDQNLPDLTVAGIETASSVVALENLAVTFAVTNIGFMARSGAIPYAVHVVKGVTASSISSSTLVKSGTLTGGIDVGGVLVGTVSLSAPELPGDYRVAVVIDPDGTVSELDSANNTGWSSAFSIGAAYTATAGTDKSVYLPGETVTITGMATRANGSPAANVQIDPYICKKGMRHSRMTTTAADGTFSATFIPTDSDAGDYGVGACYPGVNATVAQSAFAVLGMKRTSTVKPNWNMVLGETLTRSVKLMNQSSVPLTGLVVTFGEIPAECEFSWDLPDTLPANGYVTLVMTATATNVTEDISRFTAFTARIESAEGVSLEFPLELHSAPLTGVLSASPSRIDTTMTIGETRYIEVTVTNTGKGDSGKITATVPSVQWLRIAGGASIDNLASGESAVITLALSPTDEDNLTPNEPLSGNAKLNVSCANGTEANVALKFTPVTGSTGGVWVQISDNETNNDMFNAPHVSNATVRIMNKYTGEIVASGMTGTEGTWSADGIPTGDYRLMVTAAGHDSHEEDLTIEPEKTTRKYPFIAIRGDELFRATYEVVKTNIVDGADVELVLEFNTQVPMPFVRAKFPDGFEFPVLNQGASTMFTVNLVNEGLIQAENVKLNLPTIPGYTFALSENDITIPAKSTKPVTVLMTREAHPTTYSGALKMKLNVPEDADTNPNAVCVIEYENTGSSAMPAPIFEVVADGAVFTIDSAVYSNSVKVVGLSLNSPVGTLRPGEPQSLEIPVSATRSNIDWQLLCYHAGQEIAQNTRFSLRELYNDDWVLYHTEEDDVIIDKLRSVTGETKSGFYSNLGVWLDTVEPQTIDYEFIKSTFGQYQYLKATDGFDVIDEDNDPDRTVHNNPSSTKGAHEHAEEWSSAKYRLRSVFPLYGKNGTVWKWCDKCENWVLAVEATDGGYNVHEPVADETTVYVICHGNDNNISSPWVLETAKALTGKGEILAVNWGSGANAGILGVNPGYEYLAGSSAKIPETVGEARRELEVEGLGIIPSNTVFIGHSHGAHVAANIITYWSGTGKFKRFVGLDTSTTDNGVHAANLLDPKDWISVIKTRCSQVEFYKTSFDMSLEETSEMYGHYNFAVMRKGEFFEWHAGALQLYGLRNSGELSRHSYAHDWFLDTIQNSNKYKNLGFNFERKDDASWKALSGGDISAPPSSVFAGVIRDDCLEFLSPSRRRDGMLITSWRYDVAAINGQMLAQAALAGQNDRQALHALKQTWNHTADIELSAEIPTKVGNGEIAFSIRNLADNLSVNYGELLNGSDNWNTLLSVEHGRVCAWLVDLQGLEDAGVSTTFANDIDKADIMNLVSALGQTSDPQRYYKRVGIAVRNFPLPQGSPVTGSVKLQFADDVFGADKLLSNGGTPRRTLLVLSVGDVDSLHSVAHMLFYDLYWSNNFLMGLVEAEAPVVHSIMSKSPSSNNRNLASLKSLQRLSVSSEHQLSNNALKPGEEVIVTADADGSWSVKLDSHESYVTGDGELTVNRFELLDVGDETGAPRFQNGNTICDVEYVTISGQLPPATDAEGRKYVVQLTVATDDNEDDVTTCVLDVRYPVFADSDVGDPGTVPGSDKSNCWVPVKVRWVNRCSPDNKPEYGYEEYYKHGTCSSGTTLSTVIADNWTSQSSGGSSSSGGSTWYSGTGGSSGSGTFSGTGERGFTYKSNDCNKLTPCEEALLNCGQDIILNFVPGSEFYTAATGGFDCGKAIAEASTSGGTFDKIDAGANCLFTVAGFVPGAGWLSTGISCLWNIVKECGFHYSENRGASAASARAGLRALALAAADVEVQGEFETSVLLFVRENQAAIDWITEFFGSEEWCNLTCDQIRQFISRVQGNVGADHTISYDALASHIPDGISDETLQRFVTRWNNTALGLAGNSPEESGDAEAGATERMRFSKFAEYANIIEECEAEATEAGYDTAYDYFRTEAQRKTQEILDRKVSVCSSVELKFTQSIGLTREAFDGTLTIYNGHETLPITDLRMEVSILGPDGSECKDDFEKINLGTGGAMSSGWIVDGGMSVSALGTGTATIRFIPKRSMELTEETVYRFGGTIYYTDPFTGNQKQLEFTKVPLSVSPLPYLHLDYFVQRDVFADDPFTPDVVEASMPAEVAVRVRNVGGGKANNVTISSTQPMMVTNELSKGLSAQFALKDYSLDSMALNGATAHLGLNTVSLGTIGSNESKVAQWWLTSSIEGHFVDMQATVTPVNSWNTPDTTLVDENAPVHKLVRSIVADGDTLPDFLVCDGSDLYGMPDAIYRAVGEPLPVYVASVATITTLPAGSEIELPLSLTPAWSGWNYGYAVIPGVFGYTISRIVRGDGAEIPLRNAWITDRTFRDGTTPLLEERLHLVDEFASNDAQTYTVYLIAKPTDVPEVVAFEGITAGAVERDLRDAVTVVFSKPIDADTFAADDLTLTKQGAYVDNLSTLTITPADGSGTRFNIGNLTAFCDDYGRYELTVHCAGIADANGNLGRYGRSVAWTYAASGSIAPQLVSLVRRMSDGFGGTEFVVTFDRNVSAATVAKGNFTLRRNGGTMALPSAAEVRCVDDSAPYQFILVGMDAAFAEDGEYELTFVTTGMADEAGNVASGSKSVAWTVDRTPPAQITDLAISPDGGFSDTDGVTYTGTLTVSGTLPEGGLTVEIIAKYLGGGEMVLATFDGASATPRPTFSQNINLPGSGNVTLVVRLTDAAGNYSDTEKNIFVDGIALMGELRRVIANDDGSVPAQGDAEGVVTTAATLTFRERVMEGDVTIEKFTLTRDGVPVSLTGVKLCRADQVEPVEGDPRMVGFRLDKVRPFRNGLTTCSTIQDIDSPDQQPLIGDQFGFQAEVLPGDMSENVDLSITPRVYLSYYPRQYPWGYAAWKNASDAVLRVELAPAEGTNLIYRSTQDNPRSFVSPQAYPQGELFGIVQYYMEVRYWLKGENEDSPGHYTPISETQWRTPTWYYGFEPPSGFSPYTLLDSVSPGRAWFNEVNYSDDNWKRDKQFIEVCFPAGCDMTGWRINRYNQYGTLEELAWLGLTMGVPSTKAATGGDPNFAFLALTDKTYSVEEGEPCIWNRDMSAFDPFDCYGLQLVRPSGVIEQQIVVQGTLGTSPWDVNKGGEIVVETLKERVGGDWCFVGADTNVVGRSVGVYRNAGQEAADWNDSMVSTPGMLNEGQAISSDWHRPPLGRVVNDDSGDEGTIISGYDDIIANTWRLSGLESLCMDDGVYELRFDGAAVRKYSSGLTMGGSLVMRWRYENPDREPPKVTEVLFDGETPHAAYTNVFSSVSVTFSEAVNVPELIEKGLIGRAARMELLDAGGVVTGCVAAARRDGVIAPYQWDRESNTLSWQIDPLAVPAGRTRLMLDAGLIADLAGNGLAVDENGQAARSTNGLRTYTLSETVLAQVNAQAMPCWYNGELYVGEKTVDNKGKIRHYAANGTWSYLQSGGVDIEIPAQGCQGASVAFADMDGDGVAETYIGTTGGDVLKYPSGAAIVSLGANRAMPYAYDIDGDGRDELVVGGMDGRIRIISLDEDSSTYSMSVLTDANGAALTVPNGRAAPIVSDINHDGLADIVSGDTAGNVWAYLGEGTAWCAAPITVFTNNVSLADRSRLGYGDVNDDGIEDLIVGRSDGSVTTMLGAETPSPIVPFAVKAVVSASAGAHGAIVPVGDATYDGGDTPEYTITPDAGYHVADVLVDGSSIGVTNNYVFAPLTTSHTISADFAVTPYAITYTGLKGATNPNPATYTVEDAITFAVPGDVYGWVFKGWTPASIALGSIGDVEVSANWERQKFDVTVNGVTQQYNYEDEVTFVTNAVINAGATQYVCKGWAATNADPFTGDSARAEFKVLGDVSFAWLWETNVVTLAQSVNAEGLEWGTGGVVEWLPEWSENAADGLHEARCGAIPNGTNAWLLTTVEGPGVISFKWRSALASRNTKYQFLVDGEVKGMLTGTNDWTEVSISVFGDRAHEIRWRLMTGRSGASAGDCAALDDVVWTPTIPPTLAEALNVDLVWTTDGDVTWRGVARESLTDSRDAWAVVSGLGDDGTAWVQTRVYGSGILLFDWAVSCEEDYDWMELSVDGNVYDYISGDVGWTSSAVEIVGDGWHIVRWEYVKDEMDDPELAGENRAMLDNVVWNSDDVVPALTETQTTPVPVPYSELETSFRTYLDAAKDDYEAAAHMTGRNGYAIWESYVAGLEPDKEDSKFTAKIEMVDGKPVVTWEPDKPELRATRTYTIYGKKTLIDRDWTPVVEANKDQYNFFRVEVKMK